MKMITRARMCDKRFSERRENVEDDERVVRPCVSIIKENVKKLLETNVDLLLKLYTPTNTHHGKFCDGVSM